MTELPKKKKRNTRSSGTLREKAVLLTGLGLVFLLVPLIFSNSPGSPAIQAGLFWPGWLALGMGLLLLAVDYGLKRKKSAMHK
jgi:hypothetical protein